ncbi:low molecular weight protein-tyrosine-phosphatase [Arenimonas alkanexedens]
MLTEAGHGGRVRIDSAGTRDWHVGKPPDSRAIAAAARHGVDIRGQRARSVSAQDFETFDLILAADRDNLTWLRQHAPPNARAELQLALAWTGASGVEDVPDPYYGDDAGFDATCRLAQAVAQGLLRKLPPQA